MITDQRAKEISQQFQRLFKDRPTEIEEITLGELRDADARLGPHDLNAAFRIALRNRIKELEEIERTAEARVYNSKVRAWNMFTGALIGLLVAALAWFLFGS